MVENIDSTPRKAIYQIPFSRERELSLIVKTLEKAVGDKLIVDLEANSLEDAYLNLAKEEGNC